MEKTVIVIGAGLGGMATAIRLAKDGWNVRLIEKNVKVGGKLDHLSMDGFSWDVGPSVIMMPFVLRELFDYAGHDLEHYVELTAIDPITRYFFADGKTMNTWSNFHHFQIEVARREKDQGEALDGFMRYAQATYDRVGHPYLFPPSGSLSKFKANPFSRLMRFPKKLWSKSLVSVVNKYYKDPNVRQLFLSYAAMQGCSPFKVPASFNIFPFIEMQNGGWYVKGGLYRLAEALEKCARELGVEIITDSEVGEIQVKESGNRKPRVIGVTLRSGIRIDGSAVVCNADFMHAWSRLLHFKKQANVFKKFERKPFTNSSFILLLGIRKRFDKLAHHNLLFSTDYETEFKELFEKRQIPKDPSIQLTISSRTDPLQAPAGQDNYMLRMDVPAIEPDHDWSKLKETCRETILKRLENIGLTGIRNEIVCEKVITPQDLAVRSHAYRGAGYGFATHGNELNVQPLNKSPDVEGLYFVGGTTKPGGSIPFAILSSQWAIAELKRDTHFRK